MDDFERRLSVAMKTASQDLPCTAGSVGVAEAIEIPALPARRPGAPRLALAAVVVAVLVLAVGGSWWALSGRHGDTAPAGEHACTSADVTIAPVAGSGDNSYVAGFSVEAKADCTLATTPTLLGNEIPILWDATPTDTTDPNIWTPLALNPHTEVVFTVENSPVAGDTSCRGGVRPVDLRFGLDGDHLTPPFAVTVGMCAPLTFTTGSVQTTTGTGTTGSSDTACTASDLDVVPHDTGKGAAAVGVEVVALAGCTLGTPPAVALDGADAPYASSAEPGLDQTPWLPTMLRRGDSVQFELVPGPGTLVPCPSASPSMRTVTAAVAGVAVTSFVWVSDSCVADGFVLVPRSSGTAGTDACQAGDVDVSRSPLDPAVIRLVSHGGAACVLVDPPTVLADTMLVSYRPSATLAGGAAWTPRPIGPDQEIDLALSSFRSGNPNCPAEPAAGTTPTVAVRVLIGAERMLAFERPADGCGFLTVVTPA